MYVVKVATGDSVLVTAGLLKATRKLHAHYAINGMVVLRLDCERHGGKRLSLKGSIEKA